MAARKDMLERSFYVGPKVLERAIGKAREASAGICRGSLFKETFVPYSRVTHFGPVVASARRGRISRRSLLNGLSAKEKDLLPIRPSRFCKFLGLLPVKTGEIPLKVTRCAKSFFFWYRSHYCPDPIKALPDPTQYFMISGSWQANFDHLAVMAQDLGHRHTISSLKGVLRYVGLLKLPVVSSPTIDDLDHVRISPKTFPGILTQDVCRVFNNNKIPDKATCIIQSALVAKKIWKRIVKEGYLDRTLYACGGREKLTKIGPEITAFKEAKSRLVLMPELPAQMVNMAWQQSFQDELKSSDGPIWIGRGMTHASWARHYDRFIDSKTILEGDWKDFDSTISEELMVLAFQVIRMAFPANPTVDHFFNYFASGFVHKNIVTPGGFVYKVSKGIPSGSCWTSLIGSIVNWIVWVDVITNYPGFKKRNISVEDVVFTLCGDDFLLGFKDEFSLNIRELRRWVRRRHGMKIKEGCGFRTLVSSDLEKSASFLKTVFTQEGPSIRLEDLYEQIVIPKTSLNNKFQYISYLVDRLKSPPGSSLISETLAALFTYHEHLLKYLQRHLPDAHSQFQRFQSGFTYSEEFSVLLKEFETQGPLDDEIRAAMSKWTTWVTRNWARIYNHRQVEPDDGGFAKITAESHRLSMPLTKFSRLEECVAELYRGSYTY